MSEKNSIQKKINKTSQKGEVKQTRETKDKCSAKKVVVFVQADYTKALPTDMLYLRSDKPLWFKFTDGTRTLAESELGSKPEIRLTGIEGSVCEMQFVFRWDGGCGIRKDVKRNRSKRNGQTTKRQTSNSKSSRPLSKSNTKIRNNIKRARTYGEVWAKR